MVIDIAVLDCRKGEFTYCDFHRSIKILLNEDLQMGLLKRFVRHKLLISRVLMHMQVTLLNAY